jgi:hypothetical protein
MWLDDLSYMMPLQHRIHHVDQPTHQTNTLQELGALGKGKGKTKRRLEFTLIVLHVSSLDNRYVLWIVLWTVWLMEDYALLNLDMCMDGYVSITMIFIVYLLPCYV